MKHCHYISLIFLIITTTGNATQFFLYNEECPRSMIRQSDHGQITNLRVRIIADTIHNLELKAIANYLDKHHDDIEKAELPSRENVSPQILVKNLIKPTKKLTVIFAADEYRNYKFFRKILLQSEDLVIAQEIYPNDTLRLTIKAPTNEGKLLRINFSAEVDKHDNKGFLPLAFRSTRYIPNFD